MSDNFYPPPPLLKPKHYAILGGVVVAALAGGIAIGLSLKSPETVVVETPAPAVVVAENTTPAEEPGIAALPDKPFTSQFVDGQLLAYRLDTEIEGGGAE